MIFFINHGAAAWRMLGAVMLCITGTEALFADLGHFSIRSISIGFGFIVYPCVMLAYLGQVDYFCVETAPTCTSAPR